MELELYREPYKNKSYLFTTGSEVDWKGTTGVGDILFGLNAVHMMTHLIRKRRDLPQMTMNVHWEHDRDFFYHFEDPETIIERAEYLHNFYYDKDAVRMNHIFNSTDKEIQTLRYRGLRTKKSPTAVLDGLPSWPFRQDIWHDDLGSKKVVFWRPLFNKEIPSGKKKWKSSFTNDDWNKTLDILIRNGFSLTELTYRTPVSEALYHIRTCRFCIFYDGMWQYLARNLCKPAISLGNNSIIKVHSPQGVHFTKPNLKENDYYKYIRNITHNINHLDSRANRYRNFILNELELENV